MATSVKPIPDGYQQVIPYLIVRDAAKAIEFYKKVLGAEEGMRLEMGDKIGHAEVRIGESTIMLADEFPEMGGLSPDSVGGTPVSLMVYLEDVDAVFQKALAAGADEIKPVQNQFYGDRSGMFADPFGHRWSVATHIEDISPDEMQRRVAAFQADASSSDA